MNRTLNLRKRRGEKLDEWQAVLKRIKQDDQRRSAEDTRRAIVAYFEQVKDEGITAERISLLCPISNKRVVQPARGVDCTHFACFDLATFLELQSKTPNWDCPFSTCQRKLSRSTVVMDEYIADVLSKVDDLAVKIELLPSGAWKSVEIERGATDSLDVAANSDDIQVVLDKSTTRNQKEVAERTVSVSVLEELRRQIGDVLEQFNGLGYKRLGGIASALADMNIFVKQQLRQAQEPATDTCTAASIPSTSAKPVAPQTRAVAVTQDASSQTYPLEPSRDMAADSPSSVSKVAPVPSQPGSTQPFNEANADSQPIHSATQPVSPMHAPKRLPPDRDGAVKSKQARDERMSASAQSLSVDEKLRRVISSLPTDAKSSFTEFLADRNGSLAVKRALLKGLLALDEKNRPAKRRSRFDLAAAGTPTTCPPVGVLDAVPIIGPQGPSTSMDAVDSLRPAQGSSLEGPLVVGLAKTLIPTSRGDSKDDRLDAGHSIVVVA